jgi:hypothetical protein
VRALGGRREAQRRLETLNPGASVAELVAALDEARA